MEGLLQHHREKYPVAFLINGKSGGKTGKQLLHHFSEYNNCYVFDLADLWQIKQNKNHSCAIYSQFCQTLQMDNIRIVAAGGDGTVSFVCTLLDHFFQDILPIDTLQHKTQFSAKKPLPPLAILPIGVGNELSRCLGWSKGFTPSASSWTIPCLPFDKEGQFVNNVRKGNIVDLDTWDINFEPEEGSLQLPGESLGKSGLHTLLCFFSLGFDANITHKFHQLREGNPKLTSSVAMNKLWYTVYGIQEIFQPTDNVASSLELRVDGRLLPLPSNIRTLQMFNIHSSADGVDFFGVSRPSRNSELQEYSSPTINDGLLEVVGTTGVPHLLSIRAGMSHSTRLAQGNKFTIKILKPIPVQVDGEGWIQHPGTVTVSHRRSIPVICGDGPTKGFPKSFV